MSGMVDEFGEILASGRPLPRVPSRFTRLFPKPFAPHAPEATCCLARAARSRRSASRTGSRRFTSAWRPPRGSGCGAEPLRQTQQGVLYKRDHDRIDLDPVLAAPIADSFVPLTDSPSLWLALARRVGLIKLDAEGERLLAAAPEFWADNEFHLPQMIATGWLALPELVRSASRLEALAGQRIRARDRIPAVPVLLLWLSTLAESEWVALDDLAAHLTASCPAWSRLSRSGERKTNHHSATRPRVQFAKPSSGSQ